MVERADIEEMRGFYARLMAAASRSSDPRLEQAFATVPREAFLPPGPWRIVVRGHYADTPSADPAYLYQDVLVALDPEKGINNGEPSLHAAWMGAVAPVAGEAVAHVGAGAGYYTAILWHLVQPGGHVTGYEIEPHLADSARRNLSAYAGVTVIEADATRVALPPSDIIYVNAAVAAPPASWLAALKPGGRLIFPWRPSEEIALTLLVRAEAGGIAVTPLMPSWFIPCIGASETPASRLPKSRAELRAIAALHLTATRPPDDTAVAIYPEVWFSSEEVKA